MSEGRVNFRNHIKLPGSRWLMATLAVLFAWLVTPFSGFYREYAVVDLNAADRDVVMSLETTSHRYDFVAADAQRPDCPGDDCPVDPRVDANRLKHTREINYIVQNLMTAEGWRSVMYLRWDILTPDFVSELGQTLAFDFYGIAGKSWRMFVNGREVASGRGGPNTDAVKFPAPGLAGTPMTIGFEIDVGRSLAPGIVSVAQTFISRPSVAPHLRLAYRGLDKEGLIPLSIGYTILALLAALSCFLTPFYREILAFSFLVSVLNWRIMLINDMAAFPSFLSVDFVTVFAMLGSLAMAAQWAFWGLFFRVKSNLMWLPVLGYLALTPFFWACGRYGFGLDFVIAMNRNYEIHQIVAYFGGFVLATKVSWVTRGKAWAKFRTTVAMFIACLCLLVACSLALRMSVVSQTMTMDALSFYAKIYHFANYSSRAFIFSVGFAIALEWALIVRDRQRVLQRFGTVVDPRLVEDIIRGPEGQTRRIEHAVVLFVDLRSFTKMCEVFAPDRVMVALNDYLDVVTKAVQANGGVVDKFVGDAVMALWGVPELGADDSASAVRAAMDIRMGMAKLNEKRTAQGEFALDVGVGIHGGPTIFGAIGNGSRVDHTVIGPTINVASRLQGVTKDYRCDIVISHTVLEKVKSLVLIEDLGPIAIRGMTAHVSAARLLGMQVSDNEFLIGDPVLEGALTERRPGRVGGVPANVTVRDYEAFSQGMSNSGQTAA